MKCRVYMRIADNSESPRADFPFKVNARVSPTDEPLYSRPPGQRGSRPLPTAKFALDLDVPDAVFRYAEQVLAEIEVPEDVAQAAVEIAVDRG